MLLRVLTLPLQMPAGFIWCLNFKRCMDWLCCKSCYVNVMWHVWHCKLKWIICALKVTSKSHLASPLNGCFMSCWFPPNPWLAVCLWRFSGVAALAGCYALNNKTNILSLMSVAGVIAQRNITLNKTKGSTLFPPSIKDFILFRFPFTAYCYYYSFYASLH